MTNICLNCGSIDTEEVYAELSIARGQAMPPVHSFGKVLVCLECGFGEYLVPAGPLAHLRQFAEKFCDTRSMCYKSPHG
jgi:hypothetical protein